MDKVTECRGYKVEYENTSGAGCWEEKAIKNETERKEEKIRFKIEWAECI